MIQVGLPLVGIAKKLQEIAWATAFQPFEQEFFHVHRRSSSTFVASR